MTQIIALLVATTLSALTVVHAQCGMWCPAGAGLQQKFGSTTGAAGARTVAKKLRSTPVPVPVPVTGACYLSEIVTTFNTPPIPSTLETNISSTLYSGVVATYLQNDMYQVWTQQTLDESNPSNPGWLVQAIISENGNVIAQGSIIEVDAGTQLISTIQLPTAPGADFMINVLSSEGSSDARSNAMVGAPNSLVWQVGWGWNGLSQNPDCSVIPAGGATMDAQVADCSGQWMQPNLQIASQFQPFCGLTATATYGDGMSTHIVFASNQTTQIP